VTRRLRLVPDCVFDGDRLLPGAAVELDPDAGLVTGVHPAHRGQVVHPSGTDQERLAGCTLAPGLVDLQVNGGGGSVFSEDPAPGSLRAITEAHGRAGSTSIVPTLITSSPRVMKRAAAAAAEAAPSLPAMLGLHLEGPHLSRQRPGIHDPALMRPLTTSDMHTYGRLREALGKPLVMTVAPEVVTPAQISGLVSLGITVALGHSDATADQAAAAIDAGASLITHLFNAMSGVTARQPGLAGAALTDSRVRIGVIADGHHLHATTVGLALASASGRLHLVSDALSCADGGPERVPFAGRVLSVAGGVCRSPEGTIAGSAVPLAGCLHWMINSVGVPADEALRLATSAPARALGTPAGRIAAGTPADLVALDRGGVIVKVMRRAQWEQRACLS
jgi:N-acetylglucosamine-6-phosphate deacetylase